MPIRKVADLVAEQPLFAGLGPAALALIGGCASYARFAAGEPLLRRGEAADRFYLLRQGRVALENPAGAAIASLGAGDIVGVSWLAPPYRWSCDARALAPVSAVAFDAACLRRKCDADREAGYPILQRFAALVVARLQSARGLTGSG